MKVHFIGYINGKPTFEIEGHSYLPDFMRFDCDELKALGIKYPLGFLNYYEWVREQFVRRLQNSRMLKGVCK